MSFTVISVFLLFTALLATWQLSNIVIRYASQLGLLHLPNHRSSHVQVVPHGGGLAIVVVASLCGFWFVKNDSQLLAIWFLAIPLAVIGLCDDIKEVSAKLRFGVELILLILLLAVVGQLPSIGILGGLILSVLVVITGIWWVNLFNFMDGIDGIAGVQTVSMMLGAALLVTGFTYEVTNHAIWWVFLLVAASTIGFLIVNWSPARVFMGDVGSLWIGFIVFALALLTIKNQLLTYPVWLILAAVFITDSTVTLFRRVLRGQRWYEGHRSHAYQRLSRQLAIDADAIKARNKGQHKVTLLVLAINVFWLFPLAAASLHISSYAWFFVVLAYAPLLCGVVALGAGWDDNV